MEGSDELVSRANANNLNSVDRQVEIIALNLKAIGQTKIVLADDVVFSGSVLRTIASKFENNQIDVIGVRTPVATIEAYEYFNSCMPIGLKCGYLLVNDFIDQVCERDFYFGVAQSGISVKDDANKIYKSPYFKPFGNPVKRASIPEEYEDYFSDGCIRRSLRLWNEIERLSNKQILMRDLPEQINLTTDDESVVKVLKRGRF